MSVPISKTTEEACKGVYGLLGKKQMPMSARAIRKELGIPAKDTLKVDLALRHLVHTDKIERWRDKPGGYYTYWIKGVPVVAKANGKHAPAQTELNFQQAVNQQPKTEQDHKAAERSILKALADIEGDKAVGMQEYTKEQAKGKEITGSIIVPKRHIKLLLDAVLDSKESFSPELSNLILELTDKVS